MDYTVLDLEMTGLAPKRDKVIEIGAVRVRNGEIADTYGTLVRPGMSIPETVVQLTGITDEMAALGKEENVAMQELLQFIGDDILVGHNLIFDYSFLKRSAVNHGLPFVHQGIDTLKLARHFLPDAESRRLEDLCTYYHIETAHHHRAVDDAACTAEIFVKFMQEQNTDLASGAASLREIAAVLRDACSSMEKAEAQAKAVVSRR